MEPHGRPSRTARQIARLVHAGQGEVVSEIWRTATRGRAVAGFSLAIGGIALVISSLLQCSNIQDSVRSSRSQRDQFHSLRGEIVKQGRNFTLVGGEPGNLGATSQPSESVAKAVELYNQGQKASAIQILRLTGQDTADPWAALYLGLTLEDSSYAAGRRGHRGACRHLNQEAKEAYARADRHRGDFGPLASRKLDEWSGWNSWNASYWEGYFSDEDSMARLSIVVWIQLAWGAAQALFGLLLGVVASVTLRTRQMGAALPRFSVRGPSSKS